MGRPVKIFAASLVGKRFTKLIVIAVTDREQEIIVRCDCGVERVASKYPVFHGRMTSCGCSLSHPTHGKTGTLIYRTWDGMRRRCSDPNYAQYASYGGRGITVCDGWRESFENFYADMGDKPKGMSINRIDNNGGYWCGHCEQCVASGQKKNCEWANVETQQNNRRDNRRLIFNGLDMTVSQWSRTLGINRITLNNRLKRGWSLERMLTTPTQSYQRRSIQ